MTLGKDAAATLADIALAAIDATARPERWDALCDLVSDRLDAAAFMAFAYDVTGQQGVQGHFSRAMRGPEGTAIVREVDESGAQDDQPLYVAIARSAPGTLMSEQACYGLPEGSALPPNRLRERILGVTGGRARAGMRLNATGPFLDFAILHDRPGAAASPAAEIAPLLAPLLSRTLEASRVVVALARSYATLLSLFDRLSFGAAFCEPSGRLVLSNPAFDVILEDRDGLMRVGDRVTPAMGEEAGALPTALMAALRPGDDPARSAVSIQRRSGALPLLCWVMPVRSPDLGPATLALLVVLDPEAEERLSAEGLRGFGLLSEAELDVCSLLVRGFATDRIAERRDTSPETVRSQVKAATAKLACRSRLDLVRLALATQPPMGTDDHA